MINRILGILPLVTGLTGMSSIIYMNGVKGIGVDTFWTAGLMAVGVYLFLMMCMFGLGMIAYKKDAKEVEAER